MIEAEARSKWCPFARAPYARSAESTAPVVTVTRTVDMELSQYQECLPAELACLGSRCAVWCPDSPVQVSEDGRPRGHCGLAGGGS